MILKGSQRGGAGALARHLLRTDENEHVTVEEIRGFVSDNLSDALAEAEAVAKGTRCKQHLFSLSLNPPKDGKATRDDLIAAADEAEKRLGLTGCPRILVTHEKGGRRHEHAIWSRIDPVTLKAVNLSFSKMKLVKLSKELYIQHGWELPEGHKEKGQANPLNFELDEWQQAKRFGLDPRSVKQVFQDAWRRSHDLASFRRELADKGFFLARGDRRGFVAVDVHDKVFSVSRYTGVSPKNLKARLGSPELLPPLNAVQIGEKFMPTAVELSELRAQRRKHRRELTPLRWARRKIVRAQRVARIKTLKQQRTKQRAQKAQRARLSPRVPSHLRAHTMPQRTSPLAMKEWQDGGVQQVTTEPLNVRARFANESEDDYRRFRREMERQYEIQLEELRALQRSIELIRARQMAERLAMNARIALARRLQRNDERNARENRPGQLEMEF